MVTEIGKKTYYVFLKNNDADIAIGIDCRHHHRHPGLVLSKYKRLLVILLKVNPTLRKLKVQSWLQERRLRWVRSGWWSSRAIWKRLKKLWCSQTNFMGKLVTKNSNTGGETAHSTCQRNIARLKKRKAPVKKVNKKYIFALLKTTAENK